MSSDRYLHCRGALAWLCAALILGTAAPARAQKLGLGLVPMRLELKMAPGQPYSGSLKLSNESGAKTRIRAEVLDFNVDATTTPQYERDLPSEAACSCKKWLSLNPMEIEMEKGGFAAVRYTLRLPAELAEGSYNCAAGFSTLPTAEQATGMGMRMAVRIVAAFYVVVGSPSIRGMLKEMKIEPMPPTKDEKEGGWQVVVVLENQGVMYFRPTGKLDVLDATGKAVETADFPSLPVLRERDQRFLFPLKTHLEAAHYKLRAEVDIGTGEIQRGSVDVVVQAPAAAPEPDDRR